MLDIIIKYWVQWLLGLIATGVVLWTKHVVKLEKLSVDQMKSERMKELRTEIVDELTEKINKVEEKSDANDKLIKGEIEVLTNSIENLTVGILSMQGKQFREECVRLLDPEHIISFDEYQQFEEDHTAYKGLGGNHTGDALYRRVVEKFTAQVNDK